VYERLAQLAINDEGFIFDPLTGQSFTVNQTGIALLGGMKRGEDELQLAARLHQTFDVEEAEARSDVRDFIEHLRSLKLV
jgi:PqqD family protein of HPr-rel-A system